MKAAQRMWWLQARSDFELFRQLRRTGVAQCHQLHYLQMATEKLSKAYLWRSGNPPPRSHTGFVRFLRALLGRRPATELERIANILGFGRTGDLDNWVVSIQPLAYALQNMAPAEAGNGPNPEYPWPHQDPAYCPANYPFDLWTQLSDTGRGRKLMEFIGTAVRRFATYA
jgi:hypothetical protein